MDKIIRIGMDTSKHVFQLHGVNAGEKPVLRKKMRRKEMIDFFTTCPPTLVAIEACGGSHHWARLLSSFGHEVKMIAPQLAKPYVKRNKNDAADAEGLAAAAFVGTLIGLIAAVSNRFVDSALMRLTDLALAFPGLLLAMVLAGLMGGGTAPVFFGIALAQWPQFTRMTRSIAASVLTEAHVEASRLAGLAEWRIIQRQVMPRVLGQTSALAALGVGGAVLTISSLGFLGLGLQPPTPEWGAMITELLPHIDVAPIQIAAPCITLFLTVLACMAAGRRLVEAR